MSAGMDANDSSVASMTLCSCKELLALFLVIDLDVFQHKPQVEEYIKSFSDSSSLPDLAEAKISSSCSYQQPLALFSVIDIDAFQHEPQVEEYIEDFSNSSSLPGLAEAKISLPPLSDRSFLNVQTLMPAQTPDFIIVVPEVKPLPTLPSVIQALYQFKADIAEMKIATVDCNEYLQVSTVELSPSMPP